MRAVVYCRVSTKEQTQNLSLPTQRQHCVRYCKNNGWDVDRVFVEEGESAKTANRVEFQNLIEYCKRNKGRIQFVVVYALNRFSRDRLVHFMYHGLLRKLGISLRSVAEPIDDSSSGKLMETIVAGFAEFDNDVRAERTKAGMTAALERGRWVFGVPLGYLRTGGRASSIVPDPERAPLVRKAFELLATGQFNRREVLRKVTVLGLRTLRGKPVSIETFQSLIRNPIYCGLMRVRGWDGPPVHGDFQAIISEELFEAVQAVLDGRRVKAAPHLRSNPDFPLRLFVRCDECQKPLTGSWSKGRKERYAYYRCRDTSCAAVNVRKERLEPRFVTYLEALTPKSEYLRLFREIVLDVWEENRRTAVQTRRTLQSRFDDVLRRKDRIVDAFLHEKSIDRATYDRQVERLDEELLAAEGALHEARIEEIDVEGLVAFAEHVLGDPARLWTESDHEQKLRLQKVLFPHGVTYSRDGVFGTGETSVIFRLLQALPTEKGREASPTGFEPPTGGEPSGRPRQSPGRVFHRL